MRELDLDRVGVGKGPLDRGQAIALDLGLHRAGGVVSSTLKATPPFSILMSLTMSRDTRSFFSSGSMTFARAKVTDSTVRLEIAGSGMGLNFGCRGVRTVIKAQRQVQGQFAQSLCQPGTLGAYTELCRKSDL